MDIKLADYGVSQFYSPSGLHQQKGTEEYMAPELFHDKGERTAYDEKVSLNFDLSVHSIYILECPKCSSSRWTYSPLVCILG